MRYKSLIETYGNITYMETPRKSKIYVLNSTVIVGMENIPKFLVLDTKNEIITYQEKIIGAEMKTMSKEQFCELFLQMI